MNKRLNRILMAVFAMAFALGLMFQAAPVKAETPDPQAGWTTRYLERRLKTEQRWLETQQANLEKTAATITRVQAMITKAKAEGKDTTSLEASLATFQTEVGTAQDYHSDAAALLAAHAGFDDAGKVTDKAAARTTVVEAHQAINDARLTLRDANKDLRFALNDWRLTQKIKNDVKRMEKIYKNELKWADKQHERLIYTGVTVARVQALIDIAKGDGKDTAALETALTNFKASVTSAQIVHDSADAILTAHDGFDENGKVTDAAKAEVTVLTARDILFQAHETLQDGSRSLWLAVREWKQANH